MEPRADAPAAAVGERVIELGGINRLIDAPDDAPSCDLRISLAVSTAFRRAVRKARGEDEASPACDVAPGEAGRVLNTICEAVRQAYVRGDQAGPVSGGP